MKLTHLQCLEAESIHILREVVAETENPVLLYSVGKDSATLLHLARKAFHPAPPPFPLLHVHTTWKFRDMYELRDRMLIMVDDERMPLQTGEVPVPRKVRFRTLGCYPLTGAIENDAASRPRAGRQRPRRGTRQDL